jgi:hypothetical protein
MKRDFVRVLRETETEVTVVDENEVEGSDKENEQEEQTEPVKTDKRASFPNKYLSVRIIFAIFININHFYISIESRQ